MSNNLLGEVNIFLDQILDEASSFGLDVAGLTIDHIAYSTKTSQEYEEILPVLLKNGTLEKEALISSRRVAIIKLATPFLYKNSLIEIVELIEPKEGQVAISGWEHAEFLVTSYDEVLRKYPDFDWNKNHMNREHFSRLKLLLPSGREVKFLDTPVLVSAKEEKN